MKRRNILFFLLLLIFNYIPITNRGNSISDKADSLRLTMNEIDDEKDKFDFLLKIGDIYKSYDLDSALLYYQSANVLAKSLRYNEGIADSWYRQIIAYKYKNEYDSVEVLIEKYIDISLNNTDSVRIAKGYFQYGMLMKEMDLNELGINYCKKSISYVNNLSESYLLVANYNAMGTLFKNLSDYDSAAVYYLKGLNYLDKEKDEFQIAAIFNTLGDAYLYDAQFETAGKYYNMAININKKYPVRIVKLALNYINLGRLYRDQDKFIEALGYYDQAMDISLQRGDSMAIFHLYNNYGDIYFNQGNYNKAIQYFEKALNGYTRHDYLKGVVVALGNLASVYIEEGNYKQGMALNDSCLSLTYKIGDKGLRMDAYRNISKIFNKTGNYKLSREYLLKYTTLKDSIYNLKKSKFSNDLIVKYEKERQDAQILKLEKETLDKTNQRNLILYSGLGIILLIIFVSIYLRQRAVKEKIIAQHKIRQLEEEKKLMAAKMIVEGQEKERKRIARELHDGLGVLLSATKMQFTTIKDHSPENQPMIKKAIQLLEQASGDVRKISHNMMPGLLTKLGFFEAVEDLFENIHDSGELQALVEIEGEQERFTENKEIMLYRIVQELVNNALKHAKAKKIKLKIDIGPDNLHLVFADDGQGFEVEKVLGSDSESLGLKSIQSRINFLNGKVSIESKPGEGTKYSMIVPVK